MFKSLKTVFDEYPNDVLLLCYLQFEKLLTKIPMYLESCNDAEIQESIKNYLQHQKYNFKQYFINKFIHNKILNIADADAIRYGFLQFCMLKHISVITYKEFTEFAKMYNIQDKIIITNGKFNEVYDQTLSDLNDYDTYEISTFNFIAEQTTMLAVEQFPREFKNYVKLINKDGKEITAGKYSINKTSYEIDALYCLKDF